jgi:hypothetical protein
MRGGPSEVGSMAFFCGLSALRSVYVGYLQLKGFLCPAADALNTREVFDILYLYVHSEIFQSLADNIPVCSISGTRLLWFAAYWFYLKASEEASKAEWLVHCSISMSRLGEQRLQSIRDEGLIFRQL